MGKKKENSRYCRKGKPCHSCGLHEHGLLCGGIGQCKTCKEGRRNVRVWERQTFHDPNKGNVLSKKQREADRFPHYPIGQENKK